MSPCLQLKVGLPTSYPRNIQYQSKGSKQYNSGAMTINTSYQNYRQAVHSEPPEEGASELLNCIGECLARKFGINN